MKRTHVGYFRGHSRRFIGTKIKTEQKAVVESISQCHSSTQLDNVQDQNETTTLHSSPTAADASALHIGTVDLQSIYEYMERFQAEVMDSLNTIDKRLKAIEKTLPKVNAKISQEFPLRSILELNNFMEQLQDDQRREDTYLYFKNMYPECRETAVSFFRSHFADDVLIHFNWRGEQGKLSFKSNELFCIITEAWVSEYLPLQELQGMFRQEMAKCRGRRKSAKLRIKKKTEMTDADNCIVVNYNFEKLE